MSGQQTTARPWEEAETAMGTPPGRMSPTAAPRGVRERGATLGRYVIVGKLGAGGMGVVHAAYDPELDRKIALKVLRPEGEGSEGARRLMREAKAMAQLSHPNVITVHDVGTVDGEVFVAMEYIEGRTLTHWLDEQPALDAIVSVFRQAAEGLGAAHRAGLVHRDFKPDNVMIAADGAVRVLDFGLARVSALDTEADSAASTEGGESLGSGSTFTRGIVGTPAFMSPEQHRQRPVDARSDQFSFCIALHRAVYGEAPFEGGTLAELAANVASGRRVEPSEPKDVPARLARVIDRGLSVDPDERFASMDELVAAMADEPRSRRWIWVAGAASLMMVGGSAYLLGSRGPQGPVCDAAGRLEGVWDDAVRVQAQEAFARTGLAFADATFARVAGVLDRRADQWSVQYAAACESVGAGAESTRLADLRTACLSQRRAELESAAQLLVEIDASTIGDVHELGPSLRDPSRCGDLDALARGVDPPPPALAADVAEVRALLARAHVLTDAGQYDEASSTAQTALSRAEELDYRPVVAEALYVVGLTQEDRGKYKEGRDTLLTAVFEAQRLRHDPVAIDAMVLLVFVVGDSLMDGEAALLWARHADALLGDDEAPQLHALLAMYEGVAHESAGDLQTAETRLRHAVELYENQSGAPLGLARALTSLAVVVEKRGRLDEASSMYDRALTAQTDALGPEHPEVASIKVNLGDLLRKREDTEGSRRLTQEALTTLRRAYGDEHPHVMAALNNLSVVAFVDGDYEGAMKVQKQVLDLRKRVLGPDHPDVAVSHENLGGIAYMLERFDEAQTHYEAVLALRLAKMGPDHPELADAYHNLGHLAQTLEQHELARKHHAEALRIQRLHYEPGDSHVIITEQGLGRDLVQLQRYDEAQPHLEAAAKGFEGDTFDDEQRAENDFFLAVALWHSGRDRARAEVLMKRAAERFEKVGRPEDAAQSTIPPPT